MPDFSAHLDDFRKGGNVVFCHGSIYKGRLVMEGEITVAPTLYPIKWLAYSVTTGDYADMRPGFRLDICTPSGRLKLRTRLRFGYPIDANVLSVRELGKGSGSIEVGDLVRVYRDMRLSDKLVDNSQFFNPDGTLYTDQGQNPQPVPHSGGAWAGWTRMLPAFGTGTGSYTLDPDSSGDADHLWDGDGLTVDDDEAADVEFTGDTGEYLVEHTVTDVSNGKSKTAYIPYIVHDAANPPYRIQIESLPNDVQRGGSARVRFLDPIPLDDVPDGALIILWKEEYVAGTRQSFGGRAPGRSHILFVGYIRSEEGTLNGADGTETLVVDAISPLARLDELMGYSKVMLRDASPNAWNKIKALKVGRGVVQIPMEYTTLGESGHDFVFRPSFRDEDYSGFFLEASTPIGQMRELADSTMGRVVEDRRGRFEVQMKPDQVALEDRATTLTLALSMTKRDLKSLRYTREHFNTVNRIEVHGFVAGASTENNTPLFSQWVGEAPGEGNQQQKFERKIIPAINSQDALDKIAGRLGAAESGEFVDANGVKHQALDLETVHRGVYDVFDVYDEVVEFDVQTRLRELDLSEHQFVFQSASVSFDQGVGETTIRWRTCTNGLQGEPYTPADETGTLPDYTYPDYTPVSSPVATATDRIAEWTGQLPINGIILSASEAKCAQMQTFDPNTGIVSYADRSSGLSGTGIWWRSDPYNYFRGFALTTDGLYRSNDLNAGDTFTQASTNAAMFGNSSRRGYKLLMSHMRRGWIMALCGNSGAGVSPDYGATWTQVAIDGGTPSWSTSVGRGGDVAICGHNANHLYSIVQSGTAHIHSLYKSTNGGASWSLVTATGPDNGGGSASPMCLEIPYKRVDGSNNLDDANLELYAVSHSGGPQGALQFSDDGGLTWSNMLREGSITGFDPYHSSCGSSLNVFTHDASYVYYGLSQSANGAAPGLIGATANQFVANKTPTNLGNGQIGNLMVNGWSMNPNCAVAFTRGYRYSMTFDGGTTWVNANLPSGWADGVAYVEFSLFPFITARG